MPFVAADAATKPVSGATAGPLAWLAPLERAWLLTDRGSSTDLVS